VRECGEPMEIDPATIRLGMTTRGRPNSDTGGEVVFQRICAPMGRMISSIQYPFRCPCEPIDVAPSGRPDLAA
jgi:hypothetical protein